MKTGAWIAATATSARAAAPATRNRRPRAEPLLSLTTAGVVLVSSCVVPSSLLAAPARQRDAVVEVPLPLAPPPDRATPRTGPPTRPAWRPNRRRNRAPGESRPCP